MPDFEKIYITDCECELKEDQLTHQTEMISGRKKLIKVCKDHGGKIINTRKEIVYKFSCGCEILRSKAETIRVKKKKGMGTNPKVVCNNEDHHPSTTLLEKIAFCDICNEPIWWKAFRCKGHKKKYRQVTKKKTGLQSQPMKKKYKRGIYCKKLNACLKKLNKKIDCTPCKIFSPIFKNVDPVKFKKLLGLKYTGV